MTLEELKTKLQKAENSISSPMLQSNPSILESVKANIEIYKKQIAELESKATTEVNKTEKKVEATEKKVEEAKTPAQEKKAENENEKAKEDLKKAESEKKEAEKKVEAAKDLKAKADDVEKKAKATSVLKIKKPKGKEVKPVESRKVKIRKLKKMSKLKKQDLRPKAVAKKAAPVAVKKAPVAVKKAPKKEASKTVRAFGQSIEYKNNAEFCKKLITALKNRKTTSKAGGKRKTRPVFGVITNKVKDAVTQAYGSKSAKKQIEENPRQFLAKAQRLEKSAMSFLEDFKSILGNDYKKSEITSEFRELEKYIKNLVTKLSKK
jgi:hypothetical protein